MKVGTIDRLFIAIFTVVLMIGVMFLGDNWSIFAFVAPMVSFLLIKIIRSNTRTIPFASTLPAIVVVFLFAILSRPLFTLKTQAEREWSVSPQQFDLFTYVVFFSLIFVASFLGTYIKVAKLSEENNS